MSYIHEALKKAQREKERLAGKCTAIWPRKPRRSFVFKRDRSISLGIIVLAIAFAAFSWLQSIDSLSIFRNEKPGFYRAAINASAPISSNALSSRADNAVAPKPEPVPFPRIEPGDKPLRQHSFADIQNQTAPLIVNEPVRAPAPTPKSPAAGTNITFYQQALDHQKNGQLREAIDLYKAALKASPNLVSALNNLGTIYIQQKNLPEARKVLEKAIRTNAAYVDPYYNLACLHAQQKDIGRSLFYLKKAISLDEAARQWAETDEDLQNLRGHVEYEKIINSAEKS
jgi:tetratricopeptide (TPR) repeat protein